MAQDAPSGGSATGKGSSTSQATIYANPTRGPVSSIPEWVWLAILGGGGLVLFGGILWYLRKK